MVETAKAVEAAKAQGKYETTYTLEGLACATCAAEIEKAVQELSYVTEADLNFAVSKITVVSNSKKGLELSAAIQQIADRIEPGLMVRETGRGLLPVKEKQSEKGAAERGFTRRKADQAGSGQKENTYLKYRFWPGVILFALAVIFFDLSAGRPGFLQLPVFLEWLLYGLSYLLIGGPVLAAAFKNIKRGRVFDENFLMTTATLGAFAIQEFPEGVAVMLFFMIGEMFQEKAVDRSRRSIKELMDIRPDYANLVQGEAVTKADPETVGVGDVIIINPGERVPLDGEILEGSSRVDTSALTGEAVPRKLKAGDTILSGMINKDGLLTVRVNREYGQSTVAKILNLVEHASGKKAPTEKFISKFARYYTPVVVYAALATAVLPPLFLPGEAFQDWLYRALIFLVISCPCALVVSIPLSFFGGIGRASRQGILVKGGNYLEALNNVSQIVFDKTGTLTRGEFAVSKVEALNGFSKEELLEKAALAESHSSHPIARSILEAYQGEAAASRVGAYQELSGQGIKAVIDGQEILAGNSKLLESEGIKYRPVESGGTVVYLAVEHKFAGYIIITDELKEDAVQAVKGLRAAGVEELIMLTGDREDSARQVAEKLGLDRYYAGLLPDQKVEKVEELLGKQGRKGKLLFVGDGINDAPVLARSDIGVAMGGLGSDAAIEAADVVLMTDEPSKLVTAIETAGKTRQLVWQNILLALGVKGAVLIMGALGAATMWEAVFADVGVALLAVLNSMRISRMK